MSEKNEIKKLDNPLVGPIKHNKSKSANIKIIVPNKFLKPINGKIIWHIDEAHLSQDMEKYKIVYAFSQAFAKWQQYMSPIVFESTGDITKAQIVIRFMVNGMDGLPEQFEEGVLAYTYAPNGESLDMTADMYVNDEYKWDEMLHQDSVILFNVVVHELGHSFNLGHSTDISDIMYPYYQPTANVTITKDTQRGIYQLYKAYGVPNPDEEGGNTPAGEFPLKDLFKTKLDISRISRRQLLVVADFLGISTLSAERPLSIINKIYNALYQ